MTTSLEELERLCKEAEGVTFAKDSRYIAYSLFVEDPSVVLGLIARIRGLSKALEDVHELIQTGFLVRDTSRDADPMWALKIIEPMSALAKSFQAINEFGERKGEG